MTVSEAIAQATRTLVAAAVPAAAFDAELLLRHMLGRDRAWIIAHGSDRIEDNDQTRFDKMVRRRAAREPLQHITGTQEFWGLDFLVSKDVLIPRPETEFVVEAALAATKGVPAPLIIDVCTGSGCIAVSIAKNAPNARIFAIDRSEAALAVARENAKRHGVGDRIRFLAGDLFGPLVELDLAGRADIVTANPPYVKSGDLPMLQPEVKDFEPGIALVAGPEGTEIAERVIRAAPAYLRKGGRLIMEMGMDQAEAVTRMVRNSSAYGEPELVKDLMEIDRVIVAKKDRQEHSTRKIST